MNSELDETRKQLDSLIGSKINLIINSGLYKGSYPSTLEEVEDGLVGVSHPTFKGAFLPASRSTELFMKIESSNCIYQSTVAVVRSALKLNIPILWLKLASDLRKVQRRMFVRVPTFIGANAFFLEAPDFPERTAQPSKEWFFVRISDISLGGIGISIKENLIPLCLEGGRYLLLIKISNTPIFIVGKIVKIMPKRESSVEVGFAYEGMSVSAEKIMGSYIRQQELTTRG